MESRTKKLVFIALFSALLGLISQVSLPMPSSIPLTLQTFGAALCGFVLGWKKGLASCAVWLTLGAAGLPLFSGFRGGLGVLLGPTGGYLLGFLWVVLFCGIGIRGRRWVSLFCAVGGLLLCHASGVLWYCGVTNSPVVAAILSLSLPYFIKDVLCLAAAYPCAKGISRILP